MLVETFECTETAAEPSEASEEAMALIAELELEGQKSLSAKTKSGLDTRCPYREITRDELFAYRVLCPIEISLHRYASSPIPLRVLQIAAHANNLGMFPRLCVWDRQSADVHDPVLVGYTTKSEYDSGNKCFILARWGEELEPLSVLLKRAIAAKRDELITTARDCLRAHENVSDAALLAAGPAAYIHYSIR